MVSILGKSGRSCGERAASVDVLITKAVSDVPIEVGAFGWGDDQILKNGAWNAEIAVSGALAELQLKRFIGGVSLRLEQGRIQGTIGTLGVGHRAIS